MNFDDAVAAAKVTVGLPSGCDTTLFGEAGSGVTSISVWRAGEGIIDTINVYEPGISTISGIHVGSTRQEVLSTYPNATPFGDPYDDVLTITGPQGQVIVFIVRDGVVEMMILSMHPDTLAGHSLC